MILPNDNYTFSRHARTTFRLSECDFDFKKPNKKLSVLNCQEIKKLTPLETFTGLKKKARVIQDNWDVICDIEIKSTYFFFSVALPSNSKNTKNGRTLS